MFDNLPTANNNQTPAKTQIGSIPPPPRSATSQSAASSTMGLRAPVEDIYSSTDKTVLGAVNKNIPRPPVLQPKKNIGAGIPNINAFEDQPTSGIKKKIFVLFGAMFGIIFVLAIGYFVFAKFLKPQTEILETENIATSTAVLQEESVATTTEEASVVPSSISDNDNDGLTNEEEKTYGTNLNSSDSDSDGLSDRDEVMIYKTDPLKADTDGDSYLDGEEVRNGADPKGPGRLDVLPGQATTTLLSPTLPSQPLKDIDTDNDNLTDIEENKYRTDILNPDTDNDGLSDYNEVMFYKTNPLNSDSDGDGYLDGIEVKNGFNPLGEGRLAQ